MGLWVCFTYLFIFLHVHYWSASVRLDFLYHISLHASGWCHRLNTTVRHDARS
ncbi:hypothetical protein BDW59DRAFT_148735 [Aspergillus cavernicola]|uniref:Uncharacterized protein n=1 Tax=Aspergillus cavernicola TaxID=176166 RepID=A0ABR4I6F8_9EURO